MQSGFHAVFPAKTPATQIPSVALSANYPKTLGFVWLLNEERGLHKLHCTPHSGTEIALQFRPEIEQRACAHSQNYTEGTMAVDLSKGADRDHSTAEPSHRGKHSFKCLFHKKDYRGTGVGL